MRLGAIVISARGGVLKTPPVGNRVKEMEDNLGWKTAFNGRLPLMEDDL